MGGLVSVQIQGGLDKKEVSGVFKGGWAAHYVMQIASQHVTFGS